MKRDELAAIKTRSQMPQSLGYTFTHYANDIQALLIEIQRLKAQIPNWNEIDEQMEQDADRFNDLCEESAEFERRAMKAEAQALQYREALEKGPSDHDAFCTHMNHHPSPQIENCKCWQKVKAFALAFPSPTTKLLERMKAMQDVIFVVKQIQEVRGGDNWIPTMTALNKNLQYSLTRLHALEGRCSGNPVHDGSPH